MDYRSTDSEIVAYWDKPDRLSGEITYLATLTKPNGDKETRNVTKTHCEFEGLSPESEYRVEVSSAEGEVLGDLSVRTAKKKHLLDITKEPYFAVPDGKTLNTAKIQKALDDCGPGDCVYIPAGTFLTGALDIHSNSEIYLEEGALLQGTEDPADYEPLILSRFEGIERQCYRSLLNLGTLDHNSGFNCENVVIRGKGKIYGGGFELAKREAAEEEVRIREFLATLGDKIKEYENPNTPAFRVRGRLINMSNCKNIWIHGLDMGFGPAWNIHFIYSDVIVTDACTVRSGGVWNGDGWDPDSSVNSVLFNCVFFTEDDCVAIKSGKNPEGNIVNRPSKNIKVFDCETKFGHGLCIGSEMSGGVENVKIWDCKMGPTWSGIEIKATRKRGGFVKNISVRDTIASHLMVHTVGFNDDGEGAKHPPVLSGFEFKDMYLLGRLLNNNNGAMEWTVCPAVEVIGFEDPGYETSNIRFERITMENEEKTAASVRTDIYRDNLPGSVVLRNCKGVSFSDVSSVPATRMYMDQEK